MGNAAWIPPAGFEAALKSTFGVYAHCFPTPTMTGNHLLSLTRAMEDYPPLPEAVAHLLVSTSGQGRIEFCQPRAVREIVVMDARTMYIACCTDLPRGNWTWDDGPFVPFATARYLIEFTVPPGWGHVGLLPVMREGAHEGWHYPTYGTWTTWAGWTEVSLAINRGWGVRVIERILWDGRAVDPLRLWREKLLAVGEADPAYARPVRDIIIRTIGGFHRIGKTVSVFVEHVDDIPPDALSIAHARGGFTYTRRAPLSAHERQFSHPEWSTDIYARARTRLLHYTHRRRGADPVSWGALTLDPGDVLGMHTDALYLARDPQWPDPGVPGAMRVKMHARFADPLVVGSMGEMHAALAAEGSAVRWA